MPRKRATDPAAGSTKRASNAAAGDRNFLDPARASDEEVQAAQAEAQWQPMEQQAQDADAPLLAGPAAPDQGTRRELMAEVARRQAAALIALPSNIPASGC